MTMRYLLIISIILIIFSCEVKKKSMISANPALEGRWIHVHWISENEDDKPLIGAEYNLAVFDDSTYYLTCNSPFWHKSGNIIAKDDTLIFFKGDISSRDFSFVYKLENDSLKLNPLNNELNTENRDMIGLWKRD